MDRIEATISQNYYWPTLREEMRTHVNIFKTCHKTGRKTRNTAFYPLRKWELFHGTYYWKNIIGPYEIEDNSPMTLS